MSEYLNKYYKIYYNNILIASGKCIDIKYKEAKFKPNQIRPNNCISFDAKYFFNTGSNILKFQNVNNCNYFIEDINFLNSKLKVTKWANCNKYYYYDLYIENTINELDPQIEPLVKTLNKLDIYIYTVGSCCGHNEKKAFVNIKFQTLDALKKLLLIIEHKSLKYKFKLYNCPTIINNKENGVILKLQTVEIGKKAYKDIQLLTNYLKAYLNI